MSTVEVLKKALNEKGYITMTEKGRALCALGNNSKNTLALNEKSVRAFLVGTSLQTEHLENLTLTPMEVTEICI